MSLRHAGILAGGGSSRMGRDKAGLRLGGRTLLERTVAAVEAAGLAALVVGRGPPPGWPGGGCRFLIDEHPGAGPLPAIIQVLRALPGEAVLVLSCDLPRLEPATVRVLADAWDGLEPHTGAPCGLVATVGGELQPLAAVYAAAALARLDQAWSAGERSVRRVLAAEAGFVRLPLPTELAATLADCDTPADWRRLLGPESMAPEER